MANDRYYPPARRVAPESLEVGPWARRWAEQRSEEQQAQLAKKIHNSYALLQAEGKRWQIQTRRADSAEASVAQLQQQLEYVSAALVQRGEALDAATARGQALDEELRAVTEGSERAVAALTAERARLGDALRELEFTAHDLAGRVAQADVLVPELEGRLAQRDQVLVACRAGERRAATERRELQRQLDEQCEQGAELEVRLEQSLVRWKREQEAAQGLKLDFVKLRGTCSTLIGDNKRLGAELAQTRAWLKEREEAQLPETVQCQVTLTLTLTLTLTDGAAPGEPSCLRRVVRAAAAELFRPALGLGLAPCQPVCSRTISNYFARP